MCGIAGIIDWKKQPYTSVIVSMINQLKHRGPDDNGFTVLDNCILGHTRLSILDLSSNAKQPMSSNDGRFWLTYNGEIYNYKEIRTELKRNYNIQFKSNSDTEVVLYSYIEYGNKCLEKFNGMFAFAVWDNTEKTLFLARDKFGKKPLYYYHKKSNFIFASEINSIKSVPGFSTTVSLESLNCYFALGYILNPDTMYEEIKHLEPATFMKISDSGNIIEKKKYWDYSGQFLIKIKEKEKEIANNLVYLLQKSVERRLISDVPVGAFLSGGIDSSAVVKFIKNIKTDDLHTFSVGFKEISYNELPDAEKTAKFIGTNHHSIILDLNNNNKLIDIAVSAYDQLFSDTSLIPMVHVSSLASKYVTVVLSGDGADEIFAGYITYNADKYFNYSYIIPNFLKSFISNNRIVSRKKIGFNYKLSQFFYGSKFDYRKAHYSWRLIFNPEERIKLLGEKNKELIYDTDPFRKFEKYYNESRNLEKLDQHLYVDVKTWLTDDILVKLDRATMFSSIEGRCPFLDIDFVNYAASIPVNLKLKYLENKYILKKSLKNILPDFILNKKKSGFNAPVYSLMKAEHCNEFQAFNKYVYNLKINR